MGSAQSIGTGIYSLGVGAQLLRIRYKFVYYLSRVIPWVAGIATVCGDSIRT